MVKNNKKLYIIEKWETGIKLFANRILIFFLMILFADANVFAQIQEKCFENDLQLNNNVECNNSDSVFSELLKKAFKYANEGKPRRSIKHLNNLLQNCPGACFTPEAILKIEDIYIKNKHYDLANNARIQFVKLFLNKPISKEPSENGINCTDIWRGPISKTIYRIANYYSPDTRNTDIFWCAVFWYEMFISNFPNHELIMQAHYEVAGLLSVLGNHKRAFYHYEKVAKLKKETQ